MSALPSVSVVMPTYDRQDGLEAVVRPLLADPGALEVIVVVDGCEDGSLALLERLAAADARLRPLWRANGGEMRARQAGVEAARGEVVLLIDDDVLAGPGLAEGHARMHADAPGRVVLGYMPVRLPDRRTGANFASFLYAAEYEAQCERYEADPAAVLDGLWAGNLSLRRADAIAVGLPSPAFSERYHPDRELGLRLRAHGLAGTFSRGLAAEHLHERALEAFLRDARSQGRALVRLHQLHRDQLGPFEPERLSASLPAPLAALLRLARRPRARRGLEACLAVSIALAGRAGALGVQTQAARLARRVAQQSGALEAAAA